MDAAIATRMTELEAKLSFAEDLLEALDRQVFRQSEQIERLQRQVADLGARLRDISPTQAENSIDEPPPHY